MVVPPALWGRVEWGVGAVVAEREPGGAGERVGAVSDFAADCELGEGGFVRGRGSGRDGPESGDAGGLPIEAPGVAFAGESFVGEREGAGIRGLYFEGRGGRVAEEGVGVGGRGDGAVAGGWGHTSGVRCIRRC